VVARARRPRGGIYCIDTGLTREKQRSNGSALSHSPLHLVSFRIILNSIISVSSLHSTTQRAVMSSNKRKLFLNRKFYFNIILFSLFSVLIVFLFLGWEFIMEFWIASQGKEGASLQSLRGFPMAIKLSLLLLWGTLSFLLSYTFLDAKFLGVFNRIDQSFKSMMQNESEQLHFRDGDPFTFMGESFNDMKDMFLSRISKRKDLIQNLKHEVENLPVNSTRDQVDTIIEKIDKELSH